jgi:diguanylate cyclase (GGDEF)-like protein
MARNAAGWPSAAHDALTGLPNRACLNQRLQQLLDAAGGAAVAVLFINLDQSRKRNDSMGDEPGDLLLCQVADRLRSMLRPADILARLGGNEFVAAGPCPGGRETAAALAAGMLSALAAPFDICGREVFASASVGISMYPHDAGTRESLFQHADTAMYRAKAAGRNGYCFFEAEMSRQSKTRMLMEQGLRRALERGEFELHYQPRIGLAGMNMVGMEALIRWNHPQLGRVAPAQFIPIAEETGLIDDIGNWVLREACRQTGRFLRQSGRRLRVSVNLSARQLRNPGYLRQAEAALEEAGLPPHLLELELTEPMLMEEREASARMLAELKSRGIRIALGDFSTGHSALASLQTLPLDSLKLDQSFVMRQVDASSERSMKFIRALIDLAHALDLSVVAEGMETPAVLEFLRDAGCDEGQGHLFSRPLPLPEFQLFLSRLPSLPARC